MARRRGRSWKMLRMVEVRIRLLKVTACGEGE
jgi:hypothetical protein